MFSKRVLFDWLTRQKGVLPSTIGIHKRASPGSAVGTRGECAGMMEGFFQRALCFPFPVILSIFPSGFSQCSSSAPGSVQACLRPGWAENGSVLLWNKGQGSECSSFPWDFLDRVGEKNPTLSKLCYASAHQLQSTVFYPLVPIYWATTNIHTIYVISLIHTITLRGSNYHFSKWSEGLKRLSPLPSATQLFSSKLRYEPSLDSLQSPTQFY